MLKGDLQKIKALAKRNAEKAKKEIDAEEAKRKPKKGERKSIDDTLEASDAHRLFREMKKPSDPWSKE